MKNEQWVDYRIYVAIPSDLNLSREATFSLLLIPMERMLKDICGQVQILKGYK